MIADVKDLVLAIDECLDNADKKYKNILTIFPNANFKYVINELFASIERFDCRVGYIILNYVFKDKLIQVRDNCSIVCDKYNKKDIRYLFGTDVVFNKDVPENIIYMCSNRENLYRDGEINPKSVAKAYFLSENEAIIKDIIE